MDTSSDSRLVTIRQLSQMKRYSAVFTEQRLRALLFAARPRLSARGGYLPANGLYEAGAVVRVGRRIYFDASSFEAWVQSKNASLDGPLKPLQSHLPAQQREREMKSHQQEMSMTDAKPKAEQGQ